MLIEAGLFGRPSVATNVGGNPEIVDDGKTGLIVPSGNRRLLVGALSRLAHEPQLRRAMGAAAGRRIRERYSLNGMVDKYLEVYSRNVCRKG